MFTRFRRGLSCRALASDHEAWEVRNFGISTITKHLEGLPIIHGYRTVSKFVKVNFVRFGIYGQEAKEAIKFGMKLMFAERLLQHQGYSAFMLICSKDVEGLSWK